ncbi:MAG: hypothetical protein WD401_07000 [Thermomicrobiaceae bacterium]
MLYDFVAGNIPITLIIVGLVGAWAYRSRSSIQLAMNDRNPFWAVIAKIAVFSTPLFVLWVTVLDNWRQFLGYIVVTGRDYATDPFETGATPELLRAVSIALLVTSIVSLALVYARHMGAYVFLIISVVLAPIFMFTFNEVRISADAFLRLSETALENPALLDAGAILFWATGMFVITAAVVVSAYLMLFALVALPVRIIYGLTQAPKEEQLAGVFKSYERRARNSRSNQNKSPGNASLHHDVPVKS